MAHFVVGKKIGFITEGKDGAAWFFGRNPPVARNVNPVAIPPKRPDAAPDKITPRFQRKAVWRIVLGDADCQRSVYPHLV